MSQHYTKTTVEVSEWCKKCHSFTRHMVQSGRLGACIDCLAKLEQEKTEREAKPPAATQRGLFE